MEGTLEGPHWASMRALLPLYQTITTVCLGDGENTSFWMDVWDGDDSFSIRFPSLHSHCKQTDYSVAEISRNGLERRLVPRLTPAAHAELQVVNSIIQRTTLSTAADTRLRPFALPDGKLHTASLYRMLKASEGESSPASSFIWANHAPPRARFFAWLLTGDRIQSRANLRRNTVVDNDICELCNNGSETANHIMFECPEASSFWQSLGFILPSGQTTGTLPSVPAAVRHGTDWAKDGFLSQPPPLPLPLNAGELRRPPSHLQPN
ncbi:unnamed protein product [Urochloa humidicola]